MASLEDLSQDTRNELAALARELSDNPKTRKQVLALTREVKPDMPMPELDIDDRISAIQKSADERVAAIESKLSEKDMREELKRRRDALKASGKASSDEDIEAIEKVMLDRGIQSHETAAEYWDWMKQAAAPTPVAYSRNVIDGAAKTQLSAYWKNPVHAARDEAAKAFTDFRKNPRIAG